MQLAADYKVWLQNMVEGLPDEEVKECRCLEMEYFIMRTALVSAINGEQTKVLTVAVLAGKQARRR